MKSFSASSSSRHSSGPSEVPIDEYDRVIDELEASGRTIDAFEMENMALRDEVRELRRDLATLRKTLRDTALELEREREKSAKTDAELVRLLEQRRRDPARGQYRRRDSEVSSDQAQFRTEGLSFQGHIQVEEHPRWHIRQRGVDASLRGGGTGSPSRVSVSHPPKNNVLGGGSRSSAYGRRRPSWQAVFDVVSRG